MKEAVRRQEADNEVPPEVSVVGADAGGSPQVANLWRLRDKASESLPQESQDGTSSLVGRGDERSAKLEGVPQGGQHVRTESE